MNHRAAPSPFDQPIVRDTWRSKYAYRDEADWAATCRRIAAALDGGSEAFRAEILRAMLAREIVPAGRILAGAGTDKRVTLINCFVSADIQDSMATNSDQLGLGIMDALNAAAYTQQMGGGIGMDFSTVRPRGAVVRRTQSESSGVLPFMDMWNAMCATIRSSGSRRGAMMATLRCDHPDIEEFIEAKQQPERLTNFNVSVLVTDAFMEAVEHDRGWELKFPVPRADSPAAQSDERPREGHTYIYKTVPARELWSKIINSTYVHAEPGIIFIDRVNRCNNLAYCEDIHCTNPCGEQPLPSNGDCNLGHVNLAVLVRHPFSDDAVFDFDALWGAVRIMVELLDNVLDVTAFPTGAQADEARGKRRIGLGFTGLASALQQLGIRYGGFDAVAFTETVTRVIARAAYKRSVELAAERGSFPLFDADEFLRAPFPASLGDEMVGLIRRNGIRNGVLLSVAPTGTTSLVYGNISSGIEPVFSHKYTRNVCDASGELSLSYGVYDYGYLLYCELHGLDPENPGPLPTAFVTADELPVDAHLSMAAAAQRWVDAAISKTINCPESMTFGEFEGVYKKAYQLGLKGCTTYRPDPRSGRGAVLVKEGPAAPQPSSPEPAGAAHYEVEPQATRLSSSPASDKIPMQEVADGRRYRIKWPYEDCAYYVVITDYVDDAGRRRPFELFISTKSTRHDEWVKAFSLMVTAIFRREGDPTFIVDELRQVYSAKGGAFMGQRHVPSLVAAVGAKIEEHMRWLGLLPDPAELRDALDSHALEVKSLAEGIQRVTFGSICDACGAPAVVRESGCEVCKSCGNTKCG